MGKSKEHRVLIVDDIPENLKILMESLKDDYAILTATNGVKAILLASSEQQKPDIILLDIMMPEMDGYEVCRRLKEEESTRDIPIIFITAMSEDENQEHGLDLGAVDYIIKPFNPGLVRKRVHNQVELKMHRDQLEMLVQTRTREIHETRLEIIRKLGRAAEYKDNETGLHVIRMSKYCHLIALAHGLSEIESELLLNVAPMHDIGKIGIPDAILQKPGKLNTAEWEIMRQHSFMGFEIIGKHHSGLLKAAAIVAYDHHEKWNGTGYPRGIKRDDIHLYGRIIAIADVFDALTSKRPYKEPWPVEKAIEHIKKEKGEHFDPDLVNAFLKITENAVKIMEEFAD